jgi:adenosylhomocysteine nucleosidase
MIGIIGAMEIEVEGLKKALDGVREESAFGYTFYSGKIGDAEVVVTQSGIGKVNSAIAVSIMKMKYNCDFIINTGIAGGTALVKSEDVVIGTKCLYHDFDATVFGYALGQVPGGPEYYSADESLVKKSEAACRDLGITHHLGTILSGDCFVTQKETYEKMNQPEAMACEMEGCSIAQASARMGVPFVIIRYISDIIGGENQIEDYKQYEKRMAERSSAICLKIIEHLS